VLPPPDLSFESGIESAEQMMDRDAGSSYIAPFLPSPQEVIDRMLEMAEVNPRDLVYDLGSGTEELR